MGTPRFAIPVLESIRQDGHEIAAVYSKPDRKVGRGRKLSSPPVKQYAQDHQIPVEQPENFRNNLTVDKLFNYNAEALVVAAYGIFLPKKIINGLNHGCLNIHPSLLPKHRGASPVASSILEGSSKTGVTVMLLDEGMDTGPILCQREIMIEEAETCEDLTQRLFTEGGDLILDAITGLMSGTLKPIPQDDTKATLTTRFTKNDGLINWNSTSIQILRSIRAYYPWPGTFTNYNKTSLKIVSAIPFNKPIALRPGEIKMTDEVLIGTLDGAISVKEIQPNGKNILTAGDFKLGYRSLEGSILGEREFTKET